jgi:hypothetical protein
MFLQIPRRRPVGCLFPMLLAGVLVRILARARRR